MDKVVHFEIPADDMTRAAEFYKNVFGWQIQAVPAMRYTMVRTVDVDDKFMPKESGAINGGIMNRGQIKNPVITINVANIEEAAKKVESSGGKIVMQKFQVGDMGYAAYFQDTEGNILGLWQSLKS